MLTYKFWDTPQTPLQPLMHNLESATYENYEKDSVKYSLYEKVIYFALVNNSDYRVIMVVGAGRGPLVKASIKAAKSAGRDVVIYALDKNPNAVVTLYNFLSIFYIGTEWSCENVKVIEHDMRTWDPEEKADIVASELMGSFADNELEPECLECTKRLLRKGGICIPCASRNFIAPISTQKNWVNCVNSHSSAETPYMCMPFNSYVPCSSLKCFEFEYPSKGPDLSRYFKTRFKLSLEATIHGFIGYFETVLYQDIVLSIRPESYSEDLISWLPMYFPIKNMIPSMGCDVEIHIWRCINNEKVWYEWEVCLINGEEIALTSGIHNTNGKAYWIGKF